ncbi:MAG: hypothetical protein IPQ07_00735 [Myxococcales bacterium]|nr:hypothetical protein [Myxococcales bacterium]
MWRVLVIVGAVGCTSPNPRSCRDGTCTDPAFPFCDVDGALAGSPETCLAVACNGGDVAGCRGDNAIVCNATGTDYDLVACPHGCGTSGCHECTASDQCPSSRPVCDTGGGCRACALDDECPSKVCDQGTCVAESGVLYAASGGADNSACTLPAPCTAGRAIALARAVAVPPLIRLLPGAYPEGLSFDGMTSAPISIVATGAAIVASTGIAVKNGASAKIRGVSVTATTAGVECGISTGVESFLLVQDAVLAAGGTFANLVNIGNCRLTLEHSEMQLRASSGNAVSMTSDGRLVANRVHATAASIGTFGGFGSRINVTVTNSLLENSSLLFFTQDSVGPGSLIAFGSNTLVLTAGGLDCGAVAFRTQYFDNNIIFSRSAGDVANGPGCMLRYNVLSPQATAAAPTNKLADPQFVNDASGDYHVMPTSPAIDAAMATGSFPGFSADLDGIVRPQGANADIGAFERTP